MARAVVVVGAGRMGRCHLEAARAHGRVVAVVDPDLRAAEALAGRAPGAAAYPGLAACLAAVEAEVVHVCAPPESHRGLVLEAVAASCHVFVEKPLARSTGELEEILAAARAAGVRVVPVHQFPFQRGVRRIVAARPLLGEVVRVAYRTSSAGGAGWTPEARRELLADILPHAASLFHRFAPGFDPSALEVTAGREELSVRGTSEGIALEAFLTLRGRPPCNELQVTGTEASALADLFHGFAVLDRGRASGVGKAARPLLLGGRLLAAASGNGVRRALRRELSYPGLRELVAAFYASLAPGASPPVDEAEVLAATALVEAAAAAVGPRAPA